MTYISRNQTDFSKSLNSEKISTPYFFSSWTSKRAKEHEMFANRIWVTFIVHLIRNKKVKINFGPISPIKETFLVIT